MAAKRSLVLVVFATILSQSESTVVWKLEDLITAQLDNMDLFSSECDLVIPAGLHLDNYSENAKRFRTLQIGQPSSIPTLLSCLVLVASASKQEEIQGMISMVDPLLIKASASF